MYTLFDNNYWFCNNYIVRGLCGIGSVTQQDFTIQDTVKIGLSPKFEKYCLICPLGYL